jgi:hypothetical protein
MNLDLAMKVALNTFKVTPPSDRQKRTGLMKTMMKINKMRREMISGG